MAHKRKLLAQVQDSVRVNGRIRQTKERYIHDNPVFKGLVWKATAWRFSSAVYWLLDPRGETEVEWTAVEW